jgi:calpain-15
LDEIIWIRPEKYFDECPYDLFLERIEPDDIDQGGLGDCWFLSALCALAEHEDSIKRIFMNIKKIKYGCYCIALFLNGLWEEVIIDDFFPATDEDTLKFSQCSANEFWVQLLEKAYAKKMGGYAHLSAWHTTEAFINLTGAPANYFLTDWEFHKDKILPAIREAVKEKFPAAVSTFHKEKADFVGKNGLVYGHAYSLLDYIELVLEHGEYRMANKRDKERSKIRLLKLRNPWARGEWNGAW